MIKVTMSQILNAVSAFRELAKQPLYGKYSLKIARMIKKLDAESATYREEVKKIADKYSMKSDSGESKVNENGYIEFTPENQELFEKEHGDLLGAELEISVEPIKSTWLDDAKLDANSYLNLLPFIEE